MLFCFSGNFIHQPWLKKCVILNSDNLFVTVRCWNTLLEMFYIIWASCGESCDQFQLRLAGRNVSVRDHLGHFGWFWGALRRFERFVVMRLACLGFVNVFMWTKLQVSREVCILQVWYILYADYRWFNDDGMLLPHFWPVKWFNGLSVYD